MRTIKNLTFEYKKGEPVLKDLSIDIQMGDMVAIIGPNGVGKTTLIK